VPEAEQSYAIYVKGLIKHYAENVALNGVDLVVAPGKVLGLLGPNGAGKTTLINCLTTLIVPDGGRALIAGCDVRLDPAGVREQIAVTGQSVAVDEGLTGRENLVLFGRLLRLAKREAQQRAAELLVSFDLAQAADRPVGGYSGGMRRRLDLAISLVVRRPVIFLDEPTTGLDPSSRRAMWETVRGLRQDGTTILLTTQYLQEADELADDVALIDHGQVVAQGTPAELKRLVGDPGWHIQLADEAAAETAAAALRDDLFEISVTGDALLVGAAKADMIIEVLRCLDRAGITPNDIAHRVPTLDDVFFALTGQQEQVAVTAARKAGAR
jgi:ABC-2 type transport system ATP-binding protein